MIRLTIAFTEARSPSNSAATERCVLTTAVAPKPRPEKETHVNTDTKPVVAKTEAALPPPKTRKAKPHTSRSAGNAEKLVCRYCGSDDLAPSFKKRRDTRCRACFKKRYGSAARGKEAARTHKTRAAK